MSFSIRCPKCHARLRVKSRKVIGKKLPCPKCRHVFVATAPAPGATTSASADLARDSRGNGGSDSDSSSAASEAAQSSAASSGDGNFGSRTLAMIAGGGG